MWFLLRGADAGSTGGECLNKGVCLSRVMQGAGSNGSKLHTCCWFYGNVLWHFMGMNFSGPVSRCCFPGLGCVEVLDCMFDEVICLHGHVRIGSKC